MSLSSQESNLRDLRKQLSDLTLDIIELMGKRRAVGHEVQSAKISGSGFYRFVPKREIEIFSHFSDVLKDKSVKELLSISLMIEDHAQQGESHTYPAWSSQIHLTGPVTELYGQINPLLLKLQRPDLYSQLSLRQEILDLIN